MYFYEKRDLREPAVEPIGLKTYLLIRIGLNLREEEWFGLELSEPELSGPDQLELRVEARHSFRNLWKVYFCWRAEKAEEERRRIAEQENRRLQEEREARVRRAEQQIEKLAGEIMELTEEPGACRCVYESSIRKAVIQRKEENGKNSCEIAEGRDRQILPQIWQKYFPEEFHGYRERFWMAQLLPRAVLEHYVILGSCPELFGWLEDNARRIKSLRWLLLEAECSEELMDFTEDFYIEYGLAIEVQTFQSAVSFSRLKPACSLPANFIDFTGNLCFRRAEAAEGSIWLDMLADEEKKYRIVSGWTGIRYFSLKEEWKHAQRRCRDYFLPLPCYP